MDNFLDEFEWLYKGLNTRFLADRQYEWIPQIWIDYFENIDFVDCKQLKNAPDDLIKFIERTKELSVLKDYSSIKISKENEKLYTTIYGKNVKNKKLSEILGMGELISRYCEKYNITRVVDVGCGVGYLLRSILLYSPNLECIGVECDEILCQKAREKSSNINIIRLRLNSECDKNVLKDIFSPPNHSTAIICLHGCGDLQKTIIDLYLSLNEDFNPLLITVGCCYHKMKNYDENLTKYIKWNTTALRLACQERISKFMHFSAEDHTKHVGNFLERAKLECLYDFIGVKREDMSRNFARKLKYEDLKNLDDVKNLFKNVDIIVNNIDKESYDEKLREIDGVSERVKHLIEPFTMLQYYMQAVLETRLLTSRIDYIKSRTKNINISLIPISDSVSSPRNMAIVAMKE
uniref:Methyltranfer_dom domain-containing protein n=1 Tax=Strongyloides papillosus TaxID=174720 RepID=A0A0N5B6K7_STREA